MLAERAQIVKYLGVQIFVDLGDAMNGDWSTWGGAQNGNSADKYAAAFRHVHNAGPGAAIAVPTFGEFQQSNPNLDIIATESCFLRWQHIDQKP